ncbi:MAG: hypothetical protein QOH31_2449, partial [Verrucomicrobiota bacterium]
KSNANNKLFDLSRRVAVVTGGKRGEQQVSDPIHEDP